MEDKKKKKEIEETRAHTNSLETSLHVYVQVCEQVRVHELL